MTDLTAHNLLKRSCIACTCSTGLLVEEANVKNEMQRLATSLAEAQGKRELAEEGKRTVENEVDDLAASLFSQVRSPIPTLRCQQETDMHPIDLYDRPTRWLRRSDSRGPRRRLG